MRILLINELFTMGGSEIQTLREKNVLRQHGHDVWHLTFDKKCNYDVDPDDSQHINLRQESPVSPLKKLLEWLYKWLIVDPGLKEQIIALIDEINPDVLHINVNNYKQLTVYAALEKYRCIQTIRDYSAICPTSLCVDCDYRVCNGYMYSDCIRTCMTQSNLRDKLRFLLKTFNIKWVNRRHSKAIDLNLCPSQCLTDMCNNNGIQTTCLNNSFDFSILNGFKKKETGSHKVYLFYGIVAVHKGVRELVQAFDMFSADKDVELQIIGRVLDGFSSEFHDLIEGKDKIKYLGQMQYQDVIRHLETIYAVVVPSLWLENYPNTALEGLATRCLVLGSNRGGIPELIDDERFLFDIKDTADIASKLTTSYMLSPEEYKSITEDNYNRIFENNNLEAYYSRVVRVFNELIKMRSVGSKL